MPGKVEPINYTIKAEVTVNEDGLTVYHLYRILPNGASKLHRTFVEEPKHIKLPFKNSVTAAQITEYIARLFKDTYFDQGKTALMIFKHCQLKFGEAIRPLYVVNTLGLYTGKRKAPRLIIEKNESGRTVYRKESE